MLAVAAFDGALAITQSSFAQMNKVELLFPMMKEENTSQVRTILFQ